LEFEKQSTGGRGLSDVRGRTKQKDEGNYMWRFIIELFSQQQQKNYSGG
jgi:hypothetical protein